MDISVSREQNEGGADVSIINIIEYLFYLG